MWQVLDRRQGGEDDQGFETTPVLHQTRYEFNDLTEIVMCGLGRSQTPGTVQRSRCIQSERAESSKKLSSAIYMYNLFRADR